MNYRWNIDDRFPDDVDLRVPHESGGWRIIAFIRWKAEDKRYKCMFMDMGDGEYPDGTMFKTKRGAKNFCERHLPVMWIRHCAKQGEKA
jgi:hypothetical protein